MDANSKQKSDDIKKEPIIRSSTRSRFAKEPENKPLIPKPVEKVEPSWLQRQFPIYPNSRRKQFWDLIIFLGALYNAMSIPIRIAFRILWEKVDITALIITDYIVDVLYILDIVLNFFTVYFDKGMPKRDYPTIKSHYLRTWFFVDVISVIPLDFFSWVVWKHGLLRLNRLLRLARTLDYFHNWEIHSKHMHVVSLFKLFIGLVSFGVWHACLYMTLVYNEGFGSTPFVPPAEYADKGFGEQFLYSFFFAIRILTDVGGEVPGPTTNLERGFILGTCLVVLFIGAAIIAAVVDLVRNIRADSRNFTNTVGTIHVYLDRRKVNPDLRTRVVKYFHHLWSRSEGVEEETILEELPLRLRTEVNLLMNGGVVKTVPFFKDCNSGFLNSIVNYLRLEVYSPNEWIVKYGDISSEMYFIGKGEVEVLNAKGERIANLQKGSYFGEIGLLIESKRTASIRTVSYCDIYVLSKFDLDKVLKSFPEMERGIRVIAETRLISDSLRELLPKLHMFSKVSPDFVHDLQKGWKSSFKKEGEVLFSVDDYADGMYFIAKGLVLLYDHQGRIIKTLEPGPATDEGIFFGHIDTVLGHPRKTMAKVAHDTVVSFLSLEDLEALEMKYPEDWKIVLNMAGHHRDRQTQIFSNNVSSLKRPAKLLWARAMTKLIMLSRWSNFKIHQNHQWLEKLNSLKASYDEEQIEKKEAAEALEVLFQCKDQLVKMIGEHQKQQEELVAATANTLEVKALSPSLSPFLQRLSPKGSPRTIHFNLPLTPVKKTEGFTPTKVETPSNPLPPPPIIVFDEVKEGKQEEVNGKSIK